MNPNLPDRLLEGESQFQLLADFVPQLMWLANPDGWIYWYNKRCYDYTGTTPEQIVGWGWRVVLDPNALPAVMEGWTRSIATGEPFEMVFPLRAVDGTFHPFLSRVQPLKDGQGKVLRWFGTNTDISEQKRVEERLQLLLNELNHRVKNTLATVQAIARQSLLTLPPETIEAWRCLARMICSCKGIGRRRTCVRSFVNRLLLFVQSGLTTGSQLRDLPCLFQPTELPRGRWRSMSFAQMRSNMALSKRMWVRSISSGMRRS
jgi:PAS domain S-box-containing protein